MLAHVKRKCKGDFEKPSFEEKTRFLAHVLDMSDYVLIASFSYFVDGASCPALEQLNSRR